MTIATREQRGESLSPDQAEKLRTAIPTVGLRAVALGCGVAEGTIARAASGLPLYATQRNTIARWLATH